MSKDPLWNLMGLMYRAHPWHGIDYGEEAPQLVNAYIETVSSDTVKYELDKTTGILKIDRPQKFSNVCPTLYGLIPQTFCGRRVAKHCQDKTGRESIRGDRDPLDICVLTEKPINHGDILLRAIPIGGLRMIDGGEADDKIIAVMKGDDLYQDWKDIHDCPEAFINRLRHYFLTYKQLPGGDQPRQCEITDVYGRDEAWEIIRKSREDYLEHFGHIEDLVTAALKKERA